MGGAVSGAQHFHPRRLGVGGLSSRVRRQRQIALRQHVDPEQAPIGNMPGRQPSDKVLFQFGDGQICGFDPVKRQVVLLWRGRGAVPVIGKRGM
jgi:hypothetical protein